MAGGELARAQEGGGLERSRRPDELTGAQKAALWLLSVDEDLAIEILGKLSHKEVRALGDAVKELGHTSTGQLRKVHEEFQAALKQDPHLQVKGSADYLGTLARKALGEHAAAVLLGRARDDDGVKLEVADIDVLCSLLLQEHPQVIAAVVASVEPNRAGQIVNRLPGRLRQEVLARIARLNRIPREALEHAERLIAEGLPSTPLDDDNAIDGIRVAAGLLNQMDTVAAEDILDALDTDSEEVAAELRKAMFTFEDLIQLDRKGFQTLLKEVQSDQLLVALKTASEGLRSNVFDSLSKRASQMLKDDLDMMGPVRLSEVQESQQAVVAVALQLKQEGKLNLSGAGGDDFV